MAGFDDITPGPTSLFHPGVRTILVGPNSGIDLATGPVYAARKPPLTYELGVITTGDWTDHRYNVQRVIPRLDLDAQAGVSILESRLTHTATFAEQVVVNNIAELDGQTHLLPVGQVVHIYQLSESTLVDALKRWVMFEPASHMSVCVTGHTADPTSGDVPWLYSWIELLAAGSTRTPRSSGANTKFINRFEQRLPAGPDYSSSYLADSTVVDLHWNPDAGRWECDIVTCMTVAT